MAEVRWTATDPDDDTDDLLIDLAWTRDGSEWHELGTGLANTGTSDGTPSKWAKPARHSSCGQGLPTPQTRAHEFVTGEFTIINNAPTANFSFTPSPATRRDVVRFVDESTDDGWIVACHWEFETVQRATEKTRSISIA